MLKKLTRTINENKILILILSLAFLARVVGITHAFPFITHPDEPSVIRSALALRFKSNPGHFDWPHLHFYLNFILYMIFVKFRAVLQIIGLQPLIQSIFPLLWRAPLIFYYISRMFSVLLSTFTIVPIYLTASNIFGKKAGYFSALVFALMPFHIWHTHYALIDVPMTFWLSWSMYYSSRILSSDKVKNYVLAGVFIGLAASTKYNGGLAALIVPFAHLIRFSNSKGSRIISIASIKPLVLSGLFCVLSFIIGTPYAVLDFNTFRGKSSPDGALWQFTNVGKVSLFTHIQQFFNTLFVKLPDDVGLPFMALFIVVLVAFIYASIKTKKFAEKEVAFFLLSGLFLIYYISGFSKVRSHYLMPSYPFIAVTVGFALTYFYELYKHTYLKSTRFFILVVFLIPALHVIKNDYVFLRADTRNILYTEIFPLLKPNHLVIYNSNSLLVALTRSDEYEYTRIPDRERVEKENGFIILAFTDSELEKISNPTDFFHLRLTNMENVKFHDFIDSSFRTGPNILIYTFSNEQNVE